MPVVDQIVEFIKDHFINNPIVVSDNTGVYKSTGLAISVSEYSPDSKYKVDFTTYLTGSSAIDSVQFRVMVEGTQYGESSIILVGNRAVFPVIVQFLLEPNPVIGDADFDIEFRAVIGTIIINNDEIPASLNIQETYINDFT